MIDHDRKLKEFMSKKDQERTEAHEYIEEMKAKKETEKMNERETTVQVCWLLQMLHVYMCVIHVVIQRSI